MPNVSIAVQPDIFERFSDLNFRPSQAIAEFVDNAIQSYLDYKNNPMFCHAGYKLTIDITIDWDKPEGNKTYAKVITINDNAAGMSIDKFQKAFETGRRPAFNEGLNEYGMGMKTAAFWLSQKWLIVSKSFSEKRSRTIVFDVNDIVNNKRTSLEFNESEELPAGTSFTTVVLSDLHKKNNFTKRMLPAIKAELASIYRAFLRRGEIQINVNDEALLFNDPEILCAPYFSEPNGPAIEWKKQISCNLFGKEIKGFIGILKEMSEKHSGLVVMRRGRVIVGESSDHLYHPEVLHGTYKNGFAYKRIYGEIEIKGFSASFNKNGFSNMEELESMLGIIKDDLKVEGHSLKTQANKLRVNPPKPTPKVTITWRFENGSPDLVSSYDLNSKLILPDIPTRNGFKFVGWTPSVTGIVTGEATYTALWESIVTPPPGEKFLIRWVFDNGMPDKVEHYVKGRTLVLPSPLNRNGYIFSHWEPKLKYIVAADATYTAKWKKTPAPHTSNLVVGKYFNYDGRNILMHVEKTDDQQAPLLSLNLEKYESENKVISLLNVEKLPIVDKYIISNDVKNILIALSVGMFEAQMNGEDTCDGLMKNIK